MTAPRRTPPGRTPPRRGAAPPRRVPPGRTPPRRRRRPDPSQRLLHGLFGIGLTLVVLASRLVQLQGLDATAYAAKAEQQRLRRIALPAERGRIVDRNGVEMALDVDARAIYADPQLVVDPAGSAARLAPVLGRPVAEIESRLRRPGRFVYLLRGAEPAVAQRALALDLPGIGSLAESRRVYPNGGVGAPVLGFVGRDGTGLGGVEFAFDAALAGEPGEMYAEQDLGNREIPGGERRVRPAVPGLTHVLTLDRDVQWEAERALAAQVRATRAKGGQIVVMDVRSGEILALAVVPSFDPNRPAAAPPEARGNPALSSVYEPGSVNKVITAAAALEEGLLRPESTVVVPPSIKVADKVFTDAHAHGTERMTFTGVLAKSSNIGTIAIAQRLGDETVHRYLRRFGLGERTGIRFPGESAGLLPPPERWSGSQSGTVPIGQGVSATSLQVAAAYAAVANGGVRVTPSLVRGAIGRDGRLRPVGKPRRVRAVSSATAAALTAMLEAVTSDDGTAPRARIAGYRVAGKTGTARKVRADGRGYAGYVSSFVGFAPADAPRLVVSVVLDDPVPIYGGTVAAPVFRTVMGFALGRLRIPPTGRVAPPARLMAE